MSLVPVADLGLDLDLNLDLEPELSSGCAATGVVHLRCSNGCFYVPYDVMMLSLAQRDSRL